MMKLVTSLFGVASLSAVSYANQPDISWFPDTWPEPGRFLWGGEWDSMTFVHDVLHDRETPVAVFYPMNWHNLELTCVVLYSDWLDKVSGGEPPIRMPESMHSSYHRMTCIVYARQYWFAKAGKFWAAKRKELEQIQNGVGEGTLMSPEIVSKIEECFMIFTDEETRELNMSGNLLRFCLNNVKRLANVAEDDHLANASFAGAVVAEYILNDMRTTQWAWNFDGSKFADGKPCRNNCMAFMDWTGYTPVNSAHEIKDPKRWQPLVETDDKGYLFVQEHVTAQLSQMNLIIGDQAMRDRRAPDPKIDYKKEMERVYERMADFSKDDDRIAKTVVMDNKLAVLIQIMIAIDNVKPWSLESAALFLSFFVTTEHDALIMAWKEKLNHDLIRPTSVSMMMGGMWEDKDKDGTWTKAKTGVEEEETRRRLQSRHRGRGTGAGSSSYANRNTGSNTSRTTTGSNTSRTTTTNGSSNGSSSSSNTKDQTPPEPKVDLPLNLGDRVVAEVPWINDMTIDPVQWTPFIRVMPHSEYPSGSMAICQAVADFTKLFLPLDDVDLPLRINWPLSQGAAGYGLPTQDVDAYTETLDEFAQVCGQSRLWGGMHFTPAVDAARVLVEGLGAMAYDQALRVLNGNELRPHDNMRSVRECNYYGTPTACEDTPHCVYDDKAGACIRAVCLSKKSVRRGKRLKVIKDRTICEAVVKLKYCLKFKRGKCSR